MNKKRVLILLLSGAVLWLPSCASWRKTPHADMPLSLAQLVEKVEENAFRYEWFSARLSLQGEMGNSTFPNLGGQLRMEKDKAIWISANAFLGMEVVRLKITPDSVLMINKIESTYLAEPLSALMQKIGVHLSFSDVQNLLVGNVANLTVQQINTLQQIDRRTYRIERHGEASQMEQYDILSDLFKISNLRKSGLNGKAVLDYEDFQTIGNQRIPTTIDVNLIDKQRLSAVVSYSDMTLNQPKPMPMRIAENYERVYLR